MALAVAGCIAEQDTVAVILDTTTLGNQGGKGTVPGHAIDGGQLEGDGPTSEAEPPNDAMPASRDGGQATDAVTADAGQGADTAAIAVDADVAWDAAILDHARRPGWGRFPPPMRH
jgi:hypothetical protein